MFVFFAVVLITSTDLRSEDLYLEATQIISLAVGTELRFNDVAGVRMNVGGAGLSPTLTSGVTGVYHPTNRGRPIRIDIEAGIPLAYYNPFEERCVDLDPVIASPFAGWLLGGTVVWKYMGPRDTWMLATGVAAWWEYQAYNGWKGPCPMPVISLRYVLR